MKKHEWREHTMRARSFWSPFSRHAGKLEKLRVTTQIRNGWTVFESFRSTIWSMLHEIIAK